jgi:hypothetical protein
MVNIWVLFFALHALVWCIGAEIVTTDGYALLLDCGSTGSRSFVFRFTETLDTENDEKLISRTVTPITTMKIKRGISSFADENSSEYAVANHLMPMFVNASLAIPIEKHANTQVFIKGTAGMRLLPIKKQEEIWTNIIKINDNNANPFHIKKENLGTINGDDEAYYAVLASNYIAKTIDGKLNRVSGMEMVGALDMGGSSTQLIFYVGNGNGNGNNNSDKDNDNQSEDPVNASDFWSYSWLSYGAELVRERLQTLLIERHIAQGGVKYSPTNADTNADTNTNGAPTIVHNPCMQQGYSALIEYNSDNGSDSDNDNVEEGKGLYSGTYHIEGDGKPYKCLKLISQVLWPNNSCHRLANIEKEGSLWPDSDSSKSTVTSNVDTDTDTVTDRDRDGDMWHPCYVGGVQHPSLQGHFYGMSVYYYANDAINTILKTAKSENENENSVGSASASLWPNPTINELEAAAVEFCQIQWPGKPLEKSSDWSKLHPYSGNSQLPHRCFEGLYMALLLEHGFGFNGSERHITFALDIEGHEVEWTLGFALANVYLNLNRLNSAVHTTTITDNEL